VDLETIPEDPADQVEVGYQHAEDLQVEPVHHDGWSSIDDAGPGDLMTGQVEDQEAVAEDLTTEPDTQRRLAFCMGNRLRRQLAARIQPRS
jgi:hypothetical protein